MAIICNLKSQHTLRDYTVIEAGLGYASVELRNPSASENPVAFEVTVSEVVNVREIAGDDVIDYPDHLRVDRKAFDADEQELVDNRYPGAY